jgi:hypothetical protein
VTIAIRPSVGRDGAGYGFDLGQARRNIFLQVGLDSPNHRRTLICSSGRSGMACEVSYPARHPKADLEDYFAAPISWRYFNTPG